MDRRFLGYMWALSGCILFFIFLIFIDQTVLANSQDNKVLNSKNTSRRSGDSYIEDSPVRRSSSAIALTVDGQLLLAVNPDSNSLSLVDVISKTLLAEIQVGADPRIVAVDDLALRAYVSNRGSDSISVVDLVERKAIAEVVVGYRPYGILVKPDGSKLYIAEQGLDRLSILNTSTLAIEKVIHLADRPSGLALSHDGQLLYATHLLTGQVSIIALNQQAVYLPFSLSNLDFSQSFTYSCCTYYSKLEPSGFNDQPIINLWPDSNLAQSIVLSPDGHYAYVPHTRSNTTNRALTFDTTVFPLISIIDLTTSQHLVGQQLDLGTLDTPGVGLPFDAAVTPDSVELWVLNAASNDISVVNLTTRQLVKHIEVGDNPRGIVIAPDGSTVYVNNTLAGTISVLDTSTYAVTEVITVTTIPLPPVMLNGKRLFFSSDDPRISLNQWISCNTCHFEGEQDGRTWFFGFAGPRNTTSLFGMVETYPLRWSGEWNESADSEFANRKENFGSGLIAGDMNCTLSPPNCVDLPPNQGRSYDLDSLAAFIDSLAMPLSPSHAHGEPLSSAEQRGEGLFDDPDLGCITCHPAPLYTDLLMHDVGTATLDERIGPEYDTPSLRGLYDSAPYFHDGSAATLYEALTRPSLKGEHDLTNRLSVTEIEDLITFLLTLPFR